MKTIIPILTAGCLWIFCAGAGLAQNEGKHLGSTEDVTRTSKTMYSGSTGDGSEIPRIEYGGGNYGTGLYSAETGMYLNREWKPGYAVLRDKSRMDELFLRYDIYNQQMQFIAHRDTMAFSNPEELDYLFIEGKRFIYEEFNDGGVVEKGFFELLRDGECQLLLRRTVTLHLQNVDIEGNTRDEYLREVSYFLKKKEQAASEVRLSWKGVLRAFADEEENVREFMKTNDLKMNSCQDLEKVVEFYNSLH